MSYRYTTRPAYPSVTPAANGVGAYYSPEITEPISGFGADEPPIAPEPMSAETNPSLRMALWTAGFASSLALTYHGYKRGGVGGALLWGILGGIVWPITVPIAVAQGFGKPKRGA